MKRKAVKQIQKRKGRGGLYDSNKKVSEKTQDLVIAKIALFKYLMIVLVFIAA